MKLFENEEFFLNIVNQMVLAARMEQKAEQEFLRADHRLKVQRAHRATTDERCKKELEAYCKEKGIDFDAAKFN